MFLITLQNRHVGAEGYLQVISYGLIVLSSLLLLVGAPSTESTDVRFIPKHTPGTTVPPSKEPNHVLVKHPPTHNGKPIGPPHFTTNVPVPVKPKDKPTAQPPRKPDRPSSDFNATIATNHTSQSAELNHPLPGAAHRSGGSGHYIQTGNNMNSMLPLLMMSMMNRENNNNGRQDGAGGAGGGGGGGGGGINPMAMAMMMSMMGQNNQQQHYGSG